jgi:uncharacterized membrane protein YhaH (DUF805 family)
MQDKLFTSFHGRIPRSQWWLGSVLIALSQVSLIALIELAGGKAELVQGFIVFLTLIPHLAINIKRCHDLEKSGCFIIILLIPIVNLWYLAEIGFLPGTKGENRFGPDPRADQQPRRDTPGDRRDGAPPPRLDLAILGGTGGPAPRGRPVEGSVDRGLGRDRIARPDLESVPPALTAHASKKGGPSWRGSLAP